MEAKTTEWRPGPTVCRCCLTEGCYKDISTEYFWMGKREVYSEMLSETLDLNIAYSQSGGPNSNSRLICEPCISRLRDATDFKRQVLECERSFMQYLDPVGSGEIGVSIELEKDVKIERVKDEKTLLDDDDDEFVPPDFGDEDDDDLDDQPLTKLASKIPKKESVDVLDLLDNAKISEKRKSSSKSKSSPAKKSKLKKEVASSSKVKPEPRKKKGVYIQTNKSITIKTDDGSEIKLKLLKHPIDIEDLTYENEVHSENNDQSLPEQKINKNNLPQDFNQSTISIVEVPVSLDDFVFKNANDSTSESLNLKLIKSRLPNFITKREPLRSQTWEQNALTLFEFSHVYPFVDICNKYKCIVCAQVFLDAALLKDHLTAYHTIKDMNRELSNRIRDRTIKVDVSCLQCKICETSPPDLPALKAHLKAHGKSIDPDYQDNIVPFKLGGNSFECQICYEPFPKLRSIIIHMSKHFNNYTCETCGSLFITLHLLNRHLETHKIGHYPCLKCHKVFSNSNKRVRHIQSVHQKKLERKCPICPERFNSNYQRTKHLRIAHNKTCGLFRCETCGKAYEMKSQLLVHIRSVHMQERNQECSICMSRFFSKNSLSRHMTIHTGNRNFKCGLCNKEYARKKNLKDHMKSHEDSCVCVMCGRDCGNKPSLMLHMSNSHSATHE